MRAKVDGDGHNHGAGEKCNSRDLPIQAVVIEPEGAPTLKANSEPLDFRIELLPAVLTPPSEERPPQRLQPLPVLGVGEEDH